MTNPPRTDDPNAWTMSPAQVADILGIHRDTVRLWTDKGMIPCWRTPTGHRRYRRADVDALIELGRMS